jgi:hypothetical protein
VGASSQARSAPTRRRASSRPMTRSRRSAAVKGLAKRVGCSASYDRPPRHRYDNQGSGPVRPEYGARRRGARRNARGRSLRARRARRKGPGGRQLAFASIPVETCTKLTVNLRRTSCIVCGAGPATIGASVAKKAERDACSPTARARITFKAWRAIWRPDAGHVYCVTRWEGQT